MATSHHTVLRVGVIQRRQGRSKWSGWSGHGLTNIYGICGWMDDSFL